MRFAPGDRTSGFTLLELVVLVALAVILAGLVFIVVGNNRTRADRTVCLGNLKHISSMAMTFAEEHGGVFPIASGPNPPAYRSLQVLIDTVPEDWSAVHLLICPASPSDVAPDPQTGSGRRLEARNCSYAWIGARTLATDPQEWALAADDSIRSAAPGVEGNHEGGRNVVYVGMHAEWVPLSELPAGKLPERLVDNAGRGSKR